MANPRALLFLAVVALVLAPTALAQGPTPAAASMSIKSFTVTPTQGTIPLGGSMEFNVTVTVTFKNFICTAEDSSGSVSLVVLDTGLPGVSAAPPANIPITVAANTAGPDTEGTSVAVPIAVAVATTARPNHEHTFTLNATMRLTGIPTTNCHFSPIPGDAPVDSATSTQTFTIKTGPGAMNTTTTGVPPPCVGATCTPTSSTSTKASPLADVPTVALMLLAIALVAARRKK